MDNTVHDTAYHYFHNCSSLNSFTLTKKAKGSCSYRKADALFIRMQRLESSAMQLTLAVVGSKLLAIGTLPVH
jgi:hypothetical protein